MFDKGQKQSSTLSCDSSYFFMKSEIVLIKSSDQGPQWNVKWSEISPTRISTETAYYQRQNCLAHQLIFFPTDEAIILKTAWQLMANEWD